MNSFLKYTLATVVGILLYSIISTFILFGIIGVIVAASGDKETTIKPNTILYVKFDKKIVDRASNNPFEGFNFASFEPDASLGLNDILR
jgi:protease-4